MARGRSDAETYYRSKEIERVGAFALTRCFEGRNCRAIYHHEGNPLDE
jgi:hypothetical protein